MRDGKSASLNRVRPLQRARESGAKSVRKSGSFCCACRHSLRVVGTVVGKVGTGVGEVLAWWAKSGDGRSKTREKILEKSEREGMLPRIQRWSLSKNIIFPAALYCSWRSGCPGNWLASAMRGAKSEGKRSANGMRVARRRAAMRGASSARGIAKTNSVLGGGGWRWVKE